jgi:hypothetical protein
MVESSSEQEKNMAVVEDKFNMYVLLYLWGECLLLSSTLNAPSLVCLHSYRLYISAVNNISSMSASSYPKIISLTPVY